MDSKLDPARRAYILHALVEGMSIRACQRIFGVEQSTVDKLLTDAGDMAIAYLRDLNDLTIHKIQADELWSFIGAKKYTVDQRGDLPEEYGTVWGYLALCADTKLIFAYFLGEQTVEDCTFFMDNVASKLRRKEPDGEFAVRPHIATDGLKAYEKGVGRAFGDYADYGMLKKSYSKTDKNGNKKNGARFTGAVRTRMSGNPVEADIHTSFIERQNLNVRMGNRRYTRKTNAFSKKQENHERQLALWIVYHNLCWVPRPVRPLDKSGKTRLNAKGQKEPWIKRLPAAMEAGLTDRIYDITDLVSLTDEFITARWLNRRAAKQAEKSAAKAALKRAKLDLLGERRAPYWVYHSHIQHTTKVHHSDCSACNDGHGKKRGGNTKSGEWLPFESFEDAKATADKLQPDESSVCNMCLGSVRSLGYRDPARSGGGHRLLTAP